MRFSIIPLGSFIVANFVSSASAAVMGYWRFEDGAFLEDSSGNGLSIIPTASAPSPTQATIPGAGVGSAFAGTVPFSGATNGSYANFATGNFTRSDHAALLVTTQLTAEFYFNASVISGDAEMIVSQFRAATGERSWFVALQSNQIRFGSSADGTNSVNQNSTFALANQVQTGVDYYGAVVYDSGTVTFYLKDLTNNGPLVTSVVTGFSSSLNNSSSSLNIGSYSNSNPDYRFVGAIDEVRLSNTALGQSELLVSVPEPSAMVLAAAGVVVFARRRRG